MISIDYGPSDSAEREFVGLRVVTEVQPQQSRDTRALVREAVKRLANHDEWFAGEVDRGSGDAVRAKLIRHEEISKLIDRKYPG